MSEQILIKHLKAKYKDELTKIISATAETDPYYVDIELVSL